MGAEQTDLGRLADIAARTQHVHRTGDASVSDLHADTRTITPGSLFVAVRGSRTDGHDHAAAAVAAGAVALVVEHPVAVVVPQLVVEDTRRLLGPLAAEVHGRPAERMVMVGVTGTNGKTTVTHLLAAMWDAAGRSPGVVGTIGAQIGAQIRDQIRDQIGDQIGGDPLPIGFTTPEAPELQRLLRRMADGGVEMVAMEVSSHALELGRVDAITFDVAAFTNLSQDHLDFHGNMERYFATKASLFQPERSRQAVVAVDDRWGRRLLSQVAVPATTVGFADTADLRAAGVELSLTGGRLTVGGIAEFEVPLPLAGAFNVVNTLVAIGCALRVGIEPTDIRRGLAHVGPVPGRFERVEAGQDFTVVVDFAHTPDAIRTVVAAARDLTSGRVIAVGGAGGDRDRAKRPLMGVALATADLAVVTSDNPRSEDPGTIIDEMTADLAPSASVTVEPDRRRAIAAAVAEARPGDVVLILGKGHETGQDVGGVVTPFDDRTVAAEELAALLVERGR